MLKINVDNVGLLEKTKAKELYEKGYKETKKQIRQIKEKFYL